MISPYLTPKSPPERFSALLQTPPKEMKPLGRVCLSSISGVPSPFVWAGSLQGVSDWARGGFLLPQLFCREEISPLTCCPNSLLLCGVGDASW